MSYQERIFISTCLLNTAANPTYLKKDGLPKPGKFTGEKVVDDPILNLQHNNDQVAPDHSIPDEVTSEANRPEER
jgi:hypothetical protein